MNFVQLKTVSSFGGLFANCSRRQIVCSNFNQKNRNFVSDKSHQNLIEVERLSGSHEGVTVIGINNARVRNALSRSLVTQLTEAVDLLAFAQPQEVRCVIIRSLVRDIFCAGADLKERATLKPIEVAQFVSSLRRLFANIERLPMPVISSIDGTALGGGLELALATDIRTIAANAKLGLVETRLAIIPGAGGTQRLPRLIGSALAKELIFTSRIISGADALRYGLCTHAPEQNQNGDAAYLRALDLAVEILPNGPIGVRMAKRSIDGGMQCDLATGYTIEETCYGHVIPTSDRLEGLRAFAEKRKPNYLGK